MQHVASLVSIDKYLVVVGDYARLSKVSIRLNLARQLDFRFYIFGVQCP